MELNNIDTLIEKYMSGETSLEEEYQLKKYFQENRNVSTKHLRYSYLFSYFKGKSEVESKLKFEEVIINEKPVNKTRKIMIWAMAASIALLLAVSVFNKEPEQEVYAYINGKPVMNKEVAMAETQKVLLLISNNLNEGTSNLGHLKEFSKAVEVLGVN